MSEAVQDSHEPGATDAQAAAVSVRAAVRHFGAIRAVDGIDLDVRRGEIFGLIGHNGAGKSTLFKLMLGLLPLQSGQIRIRRESVQGPRFREVRRRVGYLPESVVLYDNLSGLETLRFFARLKGVPATACAPMLDRVGLADAATRAVREYSKGMRQRLGFAQAMLGDPEVLFLDEPTNGLDPTAIRHFHDTLRALTDKGVAVVISSHILAELQERVDRLAIIANGKVRATGSLDELRALQKLPLHVNLVLDADEEGVAIAAIGALALPGSLRTTTRGPRSSLAFDCDRERKMDLIGLVGSSGLPVRDLRFDESTLEDLFFDLGAKTKEAA